MKRRMLLMQCKIKISLKENGVQIEILAKNSNKKNRLQAVENALFNFYF